MTLRQRIEQEIRQHGPIPFSRYMELCLYEPQLGYYAGHAEQFGKAGDFYTASDVHAVFGRLLAGQFEEMWRAMESPAQIEILELGPGRGLFAQDVLDWSEKKFLGFFHALHYSLAESSPALRVRLHDTLKRHIEAGKASLIPTENEMSLIGVGKNGEGTASAVPVKLHPYVRALGPEAPVIVFANEFFDALPVEVISAEGTLHIDVQKGRLIETWAPTPPDLLEFLDRYAVHPEPGERVEASPLAQQYMARAAGSVQRGFVIVIDYGYTRNEQLAGRHRGTVMSYRQHSASPNPYEAPGEQDVTTHVNFTALAAAAEQCGMHAHQLLTQSQFLMGIGEANQFADAFDECRLPQERAKVALQLKHLVTPAGMGETFHVLLASKGLDPSSVASLSGLNFGQSPR